MTVKGRAKIFSKNFAKPLDKSIEMWYNISTVKKGKVYTMELINRGDIYYIDFGNGVGSEQGGIRPAIILQNNKGNYYAPTVMVAPITTAKKQKLPTHVVVFPTAGVDKVSVALYEQITTVDKTRLINKLGHKSMTHWDDRAIAIAFGCGTFLSADEKKKIEVEA